MAKFQMGRNRFTSPPFIAQTFHESLLMPGGGRLEIVSTNAANFLGQINAMADGVVQAFRDPANGKIRIPAGVPVVRASADGPSSAGSLTPAAPVTAADGPVQTYTNANIGTGTDANPNPAPISTTPVGPVPTSWPTTFAKGYRLATGDDFGADGTPVATVGEFYLTAFDVEDVMNNPDIELIRWNTLIYINWLPFWPNTAIPGLMTPKSYDLAGVQLSPAQATNVATVVWPANVQAAVRRAYQITYGREVA